MDDLITFIEAAIVIIFIIVIVLEAVFSKKIDMLESRVDYLETILQVIQEDARKNNDG